MAIVGIDLGTTFCAVATLDEKGRPVTVPNRDGVVRNGGSALEDSLNPPDKNLSSSRRVYAGQTGACSADRPDPPPVRPPRPQARRPAPGPGQ